MSREPQQVCAPNGNAAGRDINIESLYQGATPTALKLQEKILFSLAFGIDCSDAAATELMHLQAVNFGPKDLRLAWNTGCLRYSESAGLVVKTSWLKAAYGAFLVLLFLALFAGVLFKFGIIAGQSRSDVLWAAGLIVLFAMAIYGATRQYLWSQLIACRVKRVLERGCEK